MMLWTYWELGEKENANNLISKIDSQLSEFNNYNYLLEGIQFYYAFHVPFDIDAAPNFKKRLLEAGIDPNKLKAHAQVFSKSIGLILNICNLNLSNPIRRKHWRNYPRLGAHRTCDSLSVLECNLLSA